MIRIVSSSSVWATTNGRPRSEIPKVTNLTSVIEWSGSALVADMGSLKAVTASSKETPCFLRFDVAFLGSHLNFIPIYHERNARAYAYETNVAAVSRTNSLASWGYAFFPNRILAVRKHSCVQEHPVSVIIRRARQARSPFQMAFQS